MEAVLKPVTIEDGCWIGAGVTILPGVVIRAGCVIGAGSLVTKSTEADCLYYGNPAKKVHDLNAIDNIATIAKVQAIPARNKAYVNRL